MSEWSTCQECGRVVYITHLDSKHNCCFCTEVDGHDLSGGDDVGVEVEPVQVDLTTVKPTEPSKAK